MQSRVMVLVVELLGVVAVGGIACGGDDADGRCVFAGRYELGLLPRNGCASLAAPYNASGMEDECSTTIDQLSLSGARQSGIISCEPANPVVECEGFLADTDGCQWDVYLRRVER